MPAAKTPRMHHPRSRNATTSMVGLEKVTYTKSVNPRDVAENAEEEDDPQLLSQCGKHILLSKYVARALSIQQTLPSVVGSFSFKYNNNDCISERLSM